MRILYLLAPYLLICSASFSQKITIRGKVVTDDEVKSPLPGVVIFNTNKTVSTISDLNGEYSILLQSGDTLVFSHLGYSNLKLSSDNIGAVVFLPENSVQLDEVQIIGRANINDIDQRKSTGAITTISAKEIKDRSSINVIESLQGQVAGLFIKSDGELGAPLKIRIRGTSTLPIKTKGVKKEDRTALDNEANQPLIVLDGRIITADAFAMLNVNDITEIKVLKDAVANALYGIKAANGVVEITGRRGVNSKTQYSFSLQQGVTLRGRPSVKMMDSAEKLAFEFEARGKYTPGYYLSEEYIRKFYEGATNLDELIADGAREINSLKQINTDWFKELTRISTYRSYHLSARGGDEKNRFYLSGSFAKQGGKFDGNTINRFTGKLNFEHYFSKNAHAMLIADLGVSESATPNSPTYSPSSLIYTLNPYEKPISTEKLISYPGRTFTNLVNQFSRTSNSTRSGFSANMSARLFGNIRISTVIALEYLFDQSLEIVPRTAFSERSSSIPENEKGKATEEKRIDINYSTNTRVSYEKKRGQHEIFASANVDFYKNKNNLTGISGHGLPSKLNSAAGINNDIPASSGRRSTTSSRRNTNAQLGFGFSASYVWNNRVNIYGSYKRDGSSRLPQNKRWSTFWATGIGYTLSNESFLKGHRWISSLKLRATYGVTASLSGINASMAIPTFTYGTAGYLATKEFYLKGLYNKDLRPEKNSSINVGLDIGIANNINMSIETYHRRTTDMLLTIPIAPSNGFSNQLRNVGILDNKGLEFSITGSLLNTDNFRWSTSGNLAYNENKVIDLYDETELNLSNNPYPDYKEGEPADLIYGLVELGVHPADGIPRYSRADGTEFHGNLETPRGEDFVVLGHLTPPFSGGWSHRLKVKSWQLSFQLYYSFGAKAVYTNQTFLSIDRNDANTNLVSGQLENTWLRPGDGEKLHPTLFLGSGEIYLNKTYASDRTVGKTDFVRLNNVMLKHRFTKRFLSKISGHITNWEAFINIKNIATWSIFAGGDPESANLAGSSQPIITLGTNLELN